MVKGQLVMLL